MPTIHQAGIVRPAILLLLTVLFGVFVAVAAGSPDFKGLVLGVSSQNGDAEKPAPLGIKVSIVSPDSSWDLDEYLCSSKNECLNSATRGKWWSRVSGAKTGDYGYEVFIEKSQEWDGYAFLKRSAKKSGANGGFVLPQTGGNYNYYMLDLSSDQSFSEYITFK
ncbi:MAG: hypothetical protein UW82_C0007G0002 [candidate division WWE3 bacterium GW2011_GWC2_44_9]|uniref:Uncharacterized protein n=1 Tax=candidate division WWE3 bacterium GW2011_GWC2_44_9 TaxID=1619125 RepID=A0A0G1KMF9_UNCKA|nr:MAG: hypothetical protein UW82_C0007G0002 [candidate division WWE3 bacterium GW2011_GWC2_44_9]